MLGTWIAFAAGSAAFVAAERYVDRRHRALVARLRARVPHVTPVPPSLPPGRIPSEPVPPGGLGVGDIGASPSCPPGQYAVPYEDGWACFAPPPGPLVEGAPCPEEGGWYQDLECIDGHWRRPQAGTPCLSEGMDAGDLHCAGEPPAWHHPTWNGPCSPSGRYSRDGTLQCVGTSWQPAADGRMCATPGQWHPTLPLYCDNSQHWRAPTKGGPCPTKGERAPGRQDLICFDGTWHDVISCPAASAACLAVPVPGVPRYQCWAMTGHCD